MNVDFRAARRQIERHREFPASTRRQALAAYIGLFDLADESGRLEVNSALLAESLDTSRTSWLSFRQILAEAGLLSVGPRRRGQPIVLQLLPPVQ